MDAFARVALLGCCAVLTLSVAADAEPSRPDAAVANRITPPRAVDVAVTYPSGASGDQVVLLELVVGTDGTVLSAKAVSGRAPFAAAAEVAARSWTFEPARRGVQPVPATIRMQVSFTEPEFEPESEPLAGEASPSSGAKPAHDALRAPDSELEAVDVTVSGDRKGLERRLTQAEIKELPGAFGDPFRAIEVLPGVTPIVSGFPYFYVRGAPPGNVGYFFDGIPVPALYHLAAGPGVLHPAFVERIELHAGVPPARFRGFSGGVVSAAMTPPEYETRGEASLRLVDSGGMFEAPFDDARGSVMIGGRYSYTGAILSLLDSQLSIDYWDYQARVRYDLDDDDSVEVFSFGSADLFAEDVEGNGDLRTQLDIDFHRVELRWDRALPGGVWRQAVLLGIDHARLDEDSVRFSNRLVGVRSESSREVTEGLLLRAGGDVLYERLGQRLDKPATEIGSVDTEVDESGTVIAPSEDETTESGYDFSRARSDVNTGLYVDVVLEVTPGFEVTPALRGDLFVAGRDQAFGVDPRVSARVAITDSFALTHGLGLVHQPPSFLIPIPGAKPSLRGGLQRAVKHSTGVELQLPAGFTSSLELFHNLFFNMSDALGIEQLARTSDQNAEAVRADGRSYGSELLLKRNLTHRLGGLVSYTLSRSERSVDGLKVPAATDRTHVLNLALHYDIGRHFRFGSRFVFYTGIPARVATPEAAVDPPRSPPFWRLDWRLRKLWPHANGHGHWALVFEALNTTVNREVLYRDCREDPCVDNDTGPITIPSIGVELVF